MVKLYSSYLILFTFLVMGISGYSQNSSKETTVVTVTEPIENLLIYPNPVTQGKIYITSKLNKIREVEIYDVLGKRILVTSLLSKTLDVSSFSPGVYIIKVKEESATATRKLVIR